jgi:threonine/homoserine/homoserine lactone efflux protein
MSLSIWLIFCGVALLTTFTPGPATLLAISTTVAMGPRRALFCSLGNAFGLILLSGIAAAGMGIILATSAAAFTVLKFAGAGYLVYLGVRQWRSRNGMFSTAQPMVTAGAGWKLFAQGSAVALTNPQGILFFSALFPQFLSSEASFAEQFIVLTVTFSFCSILSQLFYVLLAHRVRNQLACPRRIRLFNRVSGGLFVLLGCILLRRTA